MPSGAKKRKAAKKKKENQPNNPSNNLNEAGDLDRESDDGENRSPKSQSGSNSDDENQGDVKNMKAESSIDSAKVGDSVPIEATRISKIDESVVGEATLLNEGVELCNEQSPSDVPVAPPYVVQSAVKENGKKKLTTSVEHKISSSSLETELINLMQTLDLIMVHNM